MASLLSLRDYGSGSESDSDDGEDLVQHLKPIESGHTIGQDLQIVVSPEVTSTVSIDASLRLLPEARVGSEDKLTIKAHQ